MVGSGEVHVIAIGIGIHAGAEGNTRQHGGVPPVPGHLAGTYPGGVCYLGLGTEALGQPGSQQLAVLGGDHDDAPRQGATHVSGNIGCPVSRYEVQPVVAANLLVDGVGCKDGFQTVLAVLDEEHTRIVRSTHVGNDGQLALRQTDSQGIDGQREHLGKRPLVVVGLETEAIALASAVVVDVGNEGPMVSGKVELSRLVGNYRRPRSVQFDAVGSSIVVGTKLHQRIAFAQRDAAGRRTSFGLVVPECSVQSDFRGCQHLCLAVAHFPCQPFSVGVYGHLQLSVWRRDSVVFGLCGRHAQHRAGYRCHQELFQIHCCQLFGFPLQK